MPRSHDGLQQCHRLNSGGAQGSNHDAILAGGLGDRNVQQSASDPNNRSEQTYSAAEAHDESGKGVGQKIKGELSSF